MPRAAAKAPVATQGPQRLRSEQFKTWTSPGTRARAQALADDEGWTLGEWLERQVERCEVEAEMRGTVGSRRAKIDP
jgi:hypothetical protein